MFLRQSVVHHTQTLAPKTTNETRHGRLVDAATQYDAQDVTKIASTSRGPQLPHSYAEILTKTSAHKHEPENLIDLDAIVDSSSPNYTARALDHLIDNGNTEPDMLFGNSKIPTLISEPSRRKNRWRRQRQRQRHERNLNFAIIRKEVAEANDLRERRMQMPAMADARHARADDADDFDKYVRKRTKRYFVNGFLPSITESKTAQYVTDRDLKVTKVSIFRNTRNLRTYVIIRVNVEDDGNADAMIDDPYFWPRGVTCRPWMSPNELRHQRAKGFGAHNRADDDYAPMQQRYQGDDIELENRYSALDTEYCDID